MRSCRQMQSWCALCRVQQLCVPGCQQSCSAARLPGLTDRTIQIVARRKRRARLAHNADSYSSMEHCGGSSHDCPKFASVSIDASCQVLPRTKEGRVNHKSSYNKIARAKKQDTTKNSLLPPERHGPVRLGGLRRLDALADARPGVRDFGVAPPPPREPRAAGQGARAQTEHEGRGRAVEQPRGRPPPGAVSFAQEVAPGGLVVGGRRRLRHRRVCGGRRGWC